MFAASSAGTAAAFGFFLWHDTDFWSHFAPGPVLRVATALAAGLAISSGLLFYHYRYQESYSTFEEIFFAFVLFVSSVNLLWLAPVLFFL